MTEPVQSTAEPLTVLYDGACPLCRREIAHVSGLAQKQAHCGLKFVDISDDVNPQLPDGRTVSAEERTRLLARFHIERPDGSRLSGAAAFVAMWARLPGWRHLAGLARIPGMLMVMEVAYRGFLKVRPALQWVAKRLD